MQADKFLQARPIMKAVDDSLGPEVRKQFRPWLQRIANEWAYDRAGQAGIEGFIKKARLNATIVGMGYRLSTIMMQAAGYSNSIERIGARWVLRFGKRIGHVERNGALHDRRRLGGRNSKRQVQQHAIHRQLPR